MAYIGKSPHQGVRSRFVFQASASQTTFSGSDANSLTLKYTDTLYMDVYQNGILLKAGDDYAAADGSTVVLATGASNGDHIEMIVYDVFGVHIEGAVNRVPCLEEVKAYNQHSCH